MGDRGGEDSPSNSVKFAKMKNEGLQINPYMGRAAYEKRVEHTLIIGYK
jgi:hypothetical protein